MPEQLRLFLDPSTPPPANQPTAGRAAPQTSDPEALEPRPPEPAVVLEERLRRLLNCPLNSLTLTNNRARIFSARAVASGPALDLRIHHSFVEAPDAVLQAVVDYLATPRGRSSKRAALAVVRKYFDGRAASAPSSSRSPALRPIGRTRDLRTLRDRVNARYFDGALKVDITWGRAAPRRRRRKGGFSIRLGSYNARDNLVRIHPHLDRPEVPEYVVESVVHHEMLHAAMPAVVKNGRRRLHTPEFRRRERLYQRYEDAEAWLAKHLHSLVECR